MLFRMLLLFFGVVSMPCSAEFRDPTQPAYPIPATVRATETKTGSISRDVELILSAIWISSLSRRAMINGVLAKEGETISVGSAPVLNLKSTNISALGDKRTMKPANEGADKQFQDDSMVAAPLLMQGQNAVNGVGGGDFIHQQAGKSAPGLPSSIQAHPITVTIISIEKNSVTVEQNGELKILKLVQRTYQTQ